MKIKKRKAERGKDKDDKGGVARVRKIRREKAHEEVKDGGTIPPFPHPFSWRVAYFIKHRDNFTPWASIRSAEHSIPFGVSSTSEWPVCRRVTAVGRSRNRESTWYYSTGTPSASPLMKQVLLFTYLPAPDSKCNIKPEEGLKFIRQDLHEYHPALSCSIQNYSQRFQRSRKVTFNSHSCCDLNNYLGNLRQAISRLRHQFIFSSTISSNG
jgi:hypothetical protein